MSITYSFSDNITYGTDHINNITKNLTGAGIAPFPTQDTYSVSDLNILTAEVTNQGTQLDGCLCTIVTENGKNLIQIAPGVVFFQNGVTLLVDEDGYSIEIPINTPGHIYAYFNPSLQKGDILFGEILPDDGYGVPLARVNNNNTITDCRVFARSKVATMGANATVDGELKLLETPQKHMKGYIVSSLHDVNISPFNYAIITVSPSIVGEYMYFPQMGKSMGIVNLRTGEMTFLLYIDSDGLHTKTGGYLFSRYLGIKSVMYYPLINDGRLSIVCQCNDGEEAEARDLTFPCSVVLV